MGVHSHQVKDQLREFPKLAPTFSGRARPQFALLNAGNPHLQIFARNWHTGIATPQIHEHHVAQLCRLVASRVKQRKQRLICQRTDLMKYGRAALLEERFQLVHVSRTGHLEESKPERLGARRAGTVEHRVRSGDFNPLCSGFGKQRGASLNKSRVGHGFCSLEPASQRMIREEMGRHAAQTLTRGSSTSASSNAEAHSHPDLSQVSLSHAFSMLYEDCQ